MNHDILIIGQGLAGSLLAWRLLASGAKVMVVDTGAGNASRTAAGLITPVTGKRWVKTPRVETLLPCARSLYQRLETELEACFYFEQPTLRLFQDHTDRGLAQGRLQQPSYRPYLGDSVAPASAGFGLADDLGGIWLKQTGFVHTTPLLDRLRAALQRHGAYQRQPLNYGHLSLKKGSIAWNGHKARLAIFCEGWQVIGNPWFQSLPWQPSQGEILTLQAYRSLPPFTINRGIWLLPLGANRFRLGSTYRWQPLDQAPSPAARDSLLHKLATLFHDPMPVTLIDQLAGVRPNTLDRLPIIGFHPIHPQLALFNGFGSKGALQIPYYSQCFTALLDRATPLPAEVELKRFDLSAWLPTKLK